MTTIQKMMIGFTEIKGLSDIVLSDSTQNLMVISKLDNINTIEFQNGCSLISDMLYVLADKNNQILRVGKTFIEIALKASKANLFFKDFDSNEYDIYGYIEQVMLNTELSKNTIIYNRILSTLAKCKKYAIFVEQTTGILDFLPNTIKALESNGISHVSDLIKFSRAELLTMSKIGQATIDEIVSVLGDNNIHLKGDDYHICSICKNQFVDCQNDENAVCFDCNERLNRLKRNKKFGIRIELIPSSFKDDSKGFILYADVKNNSKSIQNLSYKEAYIVSNGRQHSSNNYLSGYRWSESEDLFPNSVKTIGLIWYDNYLDFDELEENDELIIVLHSSSESKTYFFKFIYKKLELSEDEDTDTSYEFVLYDVITK